MAKRRKAGRPPAVSREMLEEAACELFFTQGYAHTSVADITRLAGVSRATFFNYFPAKGDLLWTNLDAALARLEVSIAAAGGDGRVGSGARTSYDVSAGAVDPGPAGGPRAPIVTELTALAADFEPCTVVLALANADAMGLAAELERSSAGRQQRLATILAKALRAAGEDGLTAEVIGAAYAGAFLAALRTWARSLPSRGSLAEIFASALTALSGLTGLPAETAPTAPAKGHR